MNLNAAKLEELNTLLSDEKLNLPDFRRTVGRSGNNYTWLQRNIKVHNKNINDRLTTLLNI